VKALSPGTTNISAALDGVTTSSLLTVNPAALVSIAVRPASPTITKGATEQFTATGIFTDSSTQNLTGQVTWASTTPSVATINASGLATGVGQGSSTISATMGALSGSTVLTVNTFGPGPIVTGVKRFGFHTQPTILVLSFNEALKPVTAQNTANYLIVTLGGPGRGGNRVGHVIKVANAVYNPTTFTVTLFPAERLDIHNFYRLTVNGTAPKGLTDSQGNLLDGLNNGKAGSSFVTIISRSTLVGADSLLSVSPQAPSIHQSVSALSQAVIPEVFDSLASTGQLNGKRRPM
jgi:hypothetical protein